MIPAPAMGMGQKLPFKTEDGSGLMHSRDDPAAKDLHSSLLHSFSLPPSSGFQAIRLFLPHELHISYLRFPPSPPRKMIQSAFCCPSRGPLPSAAAWMPRPETPPEALLLWATEGCSASFPECLSCSNPIYQHQKPCLAGEVPRIVLLHLETTILG